MTNEKEEKKMAESILNLRKVKPTLEEMRQGVYEATSEDKQLILEMFSFGNAIDVPTRDEIAARVDVLVEIALRHKGTILIDGPPWFTARLASALRVAQRDVVYSFESWVSMGNGASVWRHVGFIPA